jgi:hypothetical protein
MICVNLSLSLSLLIKGDRIGDGISVGINRVLIVIRLKVNQ